MLKKEILWDTIHSLFLWVKKEKYLGWDPYDWLYSPFSAKFPQFINFILLQIGVYSPLNLRPFFKIKKGISNKALALFVQAYSNLYQTSKSKVFATEAKLLIDMLKQRRIKNQPNYCWASHHFNFLSIRHELVTSVPDIVATSEGIKAFSFAYQVFNDNEYRHIANSAINSLLNLFLNDFKGYRYFKYTPNDNEKIVFNVSALALSAISFYLKHINSNENLIEIGENVVKLLLNSQTELGAWPYTYYIKTKSYYIQYDYHQGFIINGLIDFLPYIDKNTLYKKVLNAINKAVNFYMKKQFTAKGYSYYRYPMKYPIDIHNQAQGIITFSKLYEAFSKIEYLYFANKIAEWTIKNMRDKRGYFYAHKWVLLTNKIPYMRWGQAWMLLALSTLAKVMEEKD